MIFVLDNYDSFTDSLISMIKSCGSLVRVARSDTLTIHDVRRLKPKRILLSPGPGRPGDRGIGTTIIQELGNQVPILGVCLGHQEIAEHFGARVIRSEHPIHGKCTSIKHDEQGLFAGIPTPTTVMRYHSLVVDKNTVPSRILITASTCDSIQNVMGIRSNEYPIEGVQFHPESFLTPYGSMMIRNFIKGSNI